VSSIPAILTAMSFLTRQITALFNMRPNSDADPARVRLPGFGLSVSDMPADHFPTAVADWEAHPLTVREICMLSMMSRLTDKPDWHRKVFDEEIVAKWKNEALESDWAAAGIKHGDFSAKMFDYASCPLMRSCTVSLPLTRVVG